MTHNDLETAKIVNAALTLARAVGKQDTSTANVNALRTLVEMNADDDMYFYPILDEVIKGFVEALSIYAPDKNPERWRKEKLACEKAVREGIPF